MDELELIARLGLPDGIATKTSIRSKCWRCDRCGMHYEFDQPRAIPAPRDWCGGDAFSALAEKRRLKASFRGSALGLTDVRCPKLAGQSYFSERNLLSVLISCGMLPGNPPRAGFRVSSAMRSVT